MAELEKVILSEDPEVYMTKDMLTLEECQHFIEISRTKMKQALVADEKEGVVSPGRTGRNCWISHDYDDISKQVAQRISSYVGHSLENAESFQVIHYGKLQEYDQHFDAWENDESAKTNRCMKRGGQRLLTAICYLNDVQEGGGTHFPLLNITSVAKSGKILVFMNCEKGTSNRHAKSLHAGLPVLSGEKWAFNLWFREKKYDRAKLAH